MGETLMLRDDTVAEGWERWALLSSDWHWDNPHCDRRLLTRHLDQAVERNADIFVFGDMLCLMQGKYDPRADKSALREEHRGAAYFHLVRDDVVEYLRPYAGHLRLISRGNHEQATVQRHEVDILADVGAALNVPIGGYAGWVFYRLSRAQGHRTTKRLYYHHGAGGGGEMTKGTLRVVRTAAYVPDAHVIVEGHIHELWMMTLARHRNNDAGRQHHDVQYHISCSTYKQEAVLEGGFHTERQRPPKPLGAWWMRMTYDKHAPGGVALTFEMAQ